jgi:hypothetical protein
VKATTIDSLDMKQLAGEAPATAAEPAWASLDSQERARRIAEDQQRTMATVRAIEAGSANAPKMPGDAFSLHRRLERVLKEYGWLHNKGPATPDFYFTDERQALMDARATARALYEALEAI